MFAGSADKILKPKDAEWNVAKGAGRIDYRKGEYYSAEDIGLILGDESATFYPLLHGYFSTSPHPLSHFHLASSFGIMDIGGDDRGAYALGRYVPAILEENNYRMVFVANCYRPLTKTPEDALEVMREIEAACSMKFTDIINNSNLGDETDINTVMDSIAYIEELSKLSGLPVYLHTVKSGLADDLSHQLDNVMALTLQEKYFDLPEQKPANRPLWG
jgi:hypothetical protein